MSNSTVTASYTVPTQTQFVLSNSNGITFGTNASTVTASFSAPPSATSLVFSNSNNVTFGINASTLTASASFSQSVQTQNSVLINGSYGSLVFSNSNGLTFGGNNSTITASYTVPTLTEYIFSNSNGVTFGTNGSTVTASVAGAAPGSVSAGTTSVALGQVVFSNSNGVSFGLNGSTVTGTVATNYQSQGAYLTTAMASNASTQFVQANAAFNGTNAYGTIAGNAISISVNAQSTQPGIQSIQVSDTTYTTGNVIFSNANGASFGSSAGGAITLSYTVPTVTNSSWTVSDAVTSQTIGRLAFTNANGLTMTLSTSNNGNATVFGSYTVPTLTNSSMSISDAATSGTLARLAFTNLNGVTLSLSTGAGGSHTIVGSHNALTSQSNQNVTAANGGFAFQTLSFSNLNGISFGTSAGSAITASHNALTTARASTDGIGLNTAQTNVTWTVNSSGLSLNADGYAGTGTTFNGANISGSITQNSVGINLSLSVAPPGAAAENNWHHLLGANTLGNTTASGSTIGFSGINITLSGTNGSVINISAAPTSSLSGTGQVSIVTNGNTVSIGVPSAITYNGYELYPGLENNNGQVGQATLILDPFIAPNFTCDRVNHVINFSNATNSSGSQTISMWAALYTLNVSTLSLYHSGSISYAITNSGTVGSYSLVSGRRLLSMPFSTSVGAGKYWIGVVSRTTSGGANASFSQYVQSNVASTFVGHFGSSHNATQQITLGQGFYSATTSGIPNSIAISEIVGSNSLAIRAPFVLFASGTI